MRASGELYERRWSVLSERGCEASRLMYDEAVRLVERLKGEHVHGLCVITDEAAHRAMRQEASHRVSNGGGEAQRG